MHITKKAGVDGGLFGSVTNADIADALNRIDFKVTNKPSVTIKIKFVPKPSFATVTLG